MECPHLEEAVQLLAPPTFADTNTQFVCAGEIPANSRTVLSKFELE